ncbi:MAG: calcium-binding protein [Marinilabiliales bacterium]|nr:MAG: calcium-binding protein [Marinilabiliales bacterium]
MKNLLLVTFIALFLFACKTTSSTAGGPTPAEVFKKIDKNNDGVITKREAELGSDTRLKNNFVYIDKNKDGRVTLREYKKN